MGWASGFQSGIQLGNAFIQGQQRNALAEEAAKYKVGEGAYGEDVRGNLENLQAARESNLASMREQGYTPEQIATANKAYDQAQTELTRRVGLTAPDYYVTGDNSGRSYSNFKEAEQAIAPLRTQGLATVYEQSGDIEKANALRSQALQHEAAGLQIDSYKRQAKEATDTLEARDMLATIRKENDGKLTAANIMDIAGKFKLDPSKFLQAEDAAGILEVKELKRNFAEAHRKGIDGLNTFLANTYDPDKTDNIVPKIVQSKNGFVVTYGDQILPEYGQHKSLDSLVGKVYGMIDQNPMEALKTAKLIEHYDATIAKDKAIAANAGAALKASNLVTVDGPNGLEQIDRSRFMKDGVLKLPAGYRLHQESKEEAPPLHIDSQNGTVTQGKYGIVGKYDLNTNSVVPSAKNPWASDLKKAAEWEQQGVRIAPVQNKKTGKYVWGYTPDGVDFYDTPEEAAVEFAQRQKPQRGLQQRSTLPTSIPNAQPFNPTVSPYAGRLFN